MGKIFRILLVQAVFLGFMVLIGFIPMTYKTDIKPINEKGYLRPEKQMLGKRILFEAGKILR